MRCGKKLKEFTKTSDWQGRKYHKTCNELVKQEFHFKCMMEEYEKEQKKKGNLIEALNISNVG